MQAQSIAYGYDPVIGFSPPVVIAVLVVLGLLILAPAWILLARSRFLTGESHVSSANRIPQLYGYTVCLVAVITALVSVGTIIDNTFRLSDPLRAEEPWNSFQPSLDSFEAYKATYVRGEMFGRPDQAQRRDSIPDDELRRRYEALRADRIANVKFRAQRSLTTHILLLLVATALFAVHWRWLKHRVEANPSAARA